MAEDGDEKAAQAERDEIARAFDALDQDEPTFTQAAEAARAKLETLRIGLAKRFQQASNDDDLDRAEAIHKVLRSIAVLRISIADLLIERIDDSPEVKAACKRITAINAKLDEAAEDSSGAGDRLDEVTGTLTELTTLIDTVKALV